MSLRFDVSADGTAQPRRERSAAGRRDAESGGKRYISTSASAPGAVPRGAGTSK